MFIMEISITENMVCTVKCRYNAVQFTKILQALLQELGQNISVWNYKKMPHTLP